jgi:hypothetical protein
MEGACGGPVKSRRLPWQRAAAGIGMSHPVALSAGAIDSTYLGLAIDRERESLADVSRASNGRADGIRRVSCWNEADLGILLAQRIIAEPCPLGPPPPAPVESHTAPPLVCVWLSRERVSRERAMAN